MNIWSIIRAINRTALFALRIIIGIWSCWWPQQFYWSEKIYLEIKYRILQTDGTDLRYTAGDANASDLPYFANKVLHSLFADCTVSANGIKISTANGHYAHKSYIETEFSHGTDAMKNCIKCHGYECEENSGVIPAAISDKRKRTVGQFARITLYGKLAVDVAVFF